MKSLYYVENHWLFEPQDTDLWMTIFNRSDLICWDITKHHNNIGQKWKYQLVNEERPIFSCSF